MKINSATKEEIQVIKKLYMEAFPKEERKPFAIIMQKQKQGIMEILSIQDNDLVGFFITILYKDLVLVDYFAIDPNFRGKGIGSEALSLIKERYKDKRLLLEIESPDSKASNNAERIKRKEFYYKNGFIDGNIYVRVFGVDMEILTYNCVVTFTDYYGIYKYIVGELIAKKQVKLNLKSE